jgi:formylglycine-generating enzyme required for sulfatase activity
MPEGPARKKTLIRQIERVLFATFLVLTLPFLLCGGCLIFIPYGDWFFRLSGKVVDPTGDPIEGARLSLFIDDRGRPEAVETTSDKGDYSLHAGGAPPGLLRKKHILLEVERGGFKKLSAQLDDKHPPPNGFLIKLQPVNVAQWQKETAAKKASFHYLDPQFKLVWRKPDEFVMGRPSGPHVQVTLTHGFWIGQTEVTQKQWKGVMGTAPWENKGDNKEADDCPARWVDYNNAVKSCKTVTAEERRAGRLSANEEYVLPTEAQWEYAARAGTTTAYSFGDRESELGQYAWFRNNTEDAHQAYAHPVAKKKPNPWGLYDVHGNVAEWCRDFYAEAISGGVDPVGPPFGQYRVCRGGDWRDPASSCRSASRGFWEPQDRWNSLGFRVARVRIETSP